MPRVKRPVFLFFHCEDHGFVDVARLLRGELAPTTLRRLYAFPVGYGEAVPIDDGELAAVLALPSDRWVDADARLEALAAKGVVLLEEADGRLGEARRRDELLAAAGWNPHAALFHFATQWRDVDVRRFQPGGELTVMPREAVEAFVARQGTPPPAFHSVGGTGPAVELPLVERADGVFGVLARRRTTRAWDAARRMSLEDLSVVLRYVVGAHGYSPVAGGLVMVRRTSPSGGGLHPVEAYPLVAAVEGVAPGVYHYNARNHALEPLERFASAGDAHAVATGFVCGQEYFGSAHVSLVLAARFTRSHWKYRGHDKAYPAMLMDAAHLSQTLYLVATELGLGAFVTLAINSADIDARLGFDGIEQGVLAVAGCGLQAAQRSPFDPEYLPYDPRQTELEN